MSKWLSDDLDRFSQDKMPPKNKLIYYNLPLIVRETEFFSVQLNKPLLENWKLSFPLKFLLKFTVDYYYIIRNSIFTLTNVPSPSAGIG